jgi:hypothetical protein
MYTFLLNAGRRTHYRRANECYVEGFRLELSVDKVVPLCNSQARHRAPDITSPLAEAISAPDDWYDSIHETLLLI